MQNKRQQTNHSMRDDEPRNRPDPTHKLTRQTEDRSEWEAQDRLDRETEDQADREVEDQFYREREQRTLDAQEQDHAAAHDQKDADLEQARVEEEERRMRGWAASD